MDLIRVLPFQLMAEERALPKWWESLTRQWEWLSHLDTTISWGQRIWGFRRPLWTAVTWAATGLTVFLAFLEQWWQAIVVGALVLTSIAGQIYLRKTRPPVPGPTFPKGAVEQEPHADPTGRPVPGSLPIGVSDQEMPNTSELRIELEPSVFPVDLTLNEFRLRIGVQNNEGAGQFYARVWALRGIAVNAAPPWEIKWRQDAPEAYTLIKHGNKEVLELATLVDPAPQDGLLFHFHGPREDWHGVLTDPADLDSGFIQVRVWHVGLDDYVESWFQLVLDADRSPRLVKAEPHAQLAPSERQAVNDPTPEQGGYSRPELIEREEYRSHITQQIGVGEDIKDHQSRELRRGVFPNRAREAKWIADTYYGLRDRNADDAEHFGSPHDSGSLQDRLQRLVEILEYT